MYLWFEFREREFSSSSKFGGECLWKLSFQPGSLGICSCGVCYYCSYALRLKEGIVLEDKALTNQLSQQSRKFTIIRGPHENDFIEGASKVNTQSMSLS